MKKTDIKKSINIFETMAIRVMEDSTSHRIEEIKDLLDAGVSPKEEAKLRLELYRLKDKAKSSNFKPKEMSMESEGALAEDNNGQLTPPTNKPNTGAVTPVAPGTDIEQDQTNQEQGEVDSSQTVQQPAIAEDVEGDSVLFAKYTNAKNKIFDGLAELYRLASVIPQNEKDTLMPAAERHTTHMQKEVKQIRDKFSLHPNKNESKVSIEEADDIEYHSAGGSAFQKIKKAHSLTANRLFDAEARVFQTISAVRPKVESLIDHEYVSYLATTIRKSTFLSPAEKQSYLNALESEFTQKLEELERTVVDAKNSIKRTLSNKNESTIVEAGHEDDETINATTRIAVIARKIGDEKLFKIINLIKQDIDEARNCLDDISRGDKKISYVINAIKTSKNISDDEKYHALTIIRRELNRSLEEVDNKSKVAHRELENVFSMDNHVEESTTRNDYTVGSPNHAWKNAMDKIDNAVIEANQIARREDLGQYMKDKMKEDMSKRAKWVLQLEKAIRTNI